MIVIGGLVTLCGVFAFQARGHDVRAEAHDLKQKQPFSNSDVAVALQDVVQSAGNTRAQFNAFADRVSSDVGALQREFQKNQAEIAELQSQKQQLEAGRQQDRQKLSSELEEFKRRSLAKLSDLQAKEKQLEDTNSQLTASNHQLSAALESEKAKKDTIMNRFKKVAELYKSQSQGLARVVQQQQHRVEDEISGDMREALDAAGEPPALAAAAPLLGAAELSAPPPPEPLLAEPTAALPAAVAAPNLRGYDEPVLAAPEPLEKIKEMRQTLPETRMPVFHPVRDQAPPRLAAAAPQAQSPRWTVPAQPMARAPAPGLPPIAPPAPFHPAEVARRSPEVQQPAVFARAKQEAPAAQPVAQPAAAVRAPPKPVSAEDDEQLKGLRSEVERLEASVKAEDAEDAGDLAAVH